MTEPIQRVPKTGWLGSVMYLFLLLVTIKTLEGKKYPEIYIIVI